MPDCYCKDPPINAYSLFEPSRRHYVCVYCCRIVSREGGNPRLKYPLVYSFSSCLEEHTYLLFEEHISNLSSYMPYLVDLSPIKRKLRLDLISKTKGIDVSLLPSFPNPPLLLCNRIKLSSDPAKIRIFYDSPNFDVPADVKELDPLNCVIKIKTVYCKSPLNVKNSSNDFDKNIFGVLWMVEPKLWDINTSGKVDADIEEVNLNDVEMYLESMKLNMYGVTPYHKMRSSSNVLHTLREWSFSRFNLTPTYVVYGYNRLMFTTYDGKSYIFMEGTLGHLHLILTLMKIPTSYRDSVIEVEMKNGKMTVTRNGIVVYRGPLRSCAATFAEFMKIMYDALDYDRVPRLYTFMGELIKDVWPKAPTTIKSDTIYINSLK